MGKGELVLVYDADVSTVVGCETRANAEKEAADFDKFLIGDVLYINFDETKDIGRMVKTPSKV